MAFDKLRLYENWDSMTFKEDIDSTVLLNIVKNFDNVYPLLGKIKDKKNYKHIQDKKTVLTILLQRLKGHKNNEFTYKSKNGERLIPNGYSLCCMNKILRHTFVGKTHYDIDIVNAHPSFLLWYSRNSKWACKHLTDYVENRELFLQKVQNQLLIDREMSKDLVLSLLFDQNKCIEPSSILYDLYEEIKQIQDKVKEEYKDIYNRSRTDKNNRKGSCLSKFLQTIENKVCQVMITYCRDNNIHISAPCYDGILISKVDCDNIEGGLQGLLNKIEFKVKNDLDIDISLKEKEMTLGINNYLEEIVNEKRITMEKDIKTNYLDRNQFTDESIGKYIIKKMIDEETIYYDEIIDELYYYNESTCLFQREKKNFLLTKISEYAIPYAEYCEAGLDLSADDGIFMIKLKDKLGTTKDQKNILTQIDVRLPKNNQFIKEMFNKTKHLFPIKNNKVIDFKTDTIRNRTKKDYFTFSVDIDYDKYVDEKPVIDWLIQYLIPNGKKLDEDDYKHVNCFLDFQGYLATGENNLKAIAIYKGKKDSGKSTTSKKLNKTFGDEKFVSTVHKKVFCESRSSSVHETELFKLKFSRVGFFSELKEDDKPNEDFIKRVSGDDKFIPARKCGASEQESLILDFKIVIPTNHIWETSDPALQSRLKFFEFPNLFNKDDPCIEEIEKYIDSLDVSSVIFKRAHKFYQNKRTIKWSKQVNFSSDKEITELDPIKQFVNDFFVFTDNDKDRILISDIFQLFQNENPTNELSKHKNRFIKKFEENIPTTVTRYNRTYFRKILLNNNNI